MANFSQVCKQYVCFILLLCIQSGVFFLAAYLGFTQYIIWYARVPWIEWWQFHLALCYQNATLMAFNTCPLKFIQSSFDPELKALFAYRAIHEYTSFSHYFQLFTSAFNWSDTELNKGFHNTHLPLICTGSSPTNKHFSVYCHWTTTTTSQKLLHDCQSLAEEFQVGNRVFGYTILLYQRNTQRDSHQYEKVHTPSLINQLQNSADWRNTDICDSQELS